MSSKTNIKFLAVDIDGTLVNRDQSVSQANRKALLSALDRDIKIGLFTGRSVKEALPARDAVFGKRSGDVYLGCLSGAHISCGNPPETLFTTAIAREDVFAASTALNSVGITAVGIADSCSGGPDHIVLAGYDINYVRSKWLNSKEHFVSHFVDSADELLSEKLPRIMRLTAVVPNDQREKAAPAISAIEKLNHPIRVEAIYAPNYDMFVVECFSTAINKYLGVRQICDSLGIAADQIAAIGDDINDLPMIENARVSAAMASASDNVKAAATIVVPPVESDGLSAFVNDLLSGRWG